MGIKLQFLHITLVSKIQRGVVMLSTPRITWWGNYFRYYCGTSQLFELALLDFFL